MKNQTQKYEHFFIFPPITLLFIFFAQNGFTHVFFQQNDR